MKVHHYSFFNVKEIFFSVLINGTSLIRAFSNRCGFRWRQHHTTCARHLVGAVDYTSNYNCVDMSNEALSRVLAHCTDVLWRRKLLIFYSDDTHASMSQRCIGATTCMGKRKFMNRANTCKKVPK